MAQLDQMLGARGTMSLLFLADPVFMTQCVRAMMALCLKQDQHKAITPRALPLLQVFSLR
jgi:hypothetical protein